MEYAVRLESTGSLPADARTLCGPNLRPLLPPPGTLSALYFGSEFCEHRLPCIQEASSHCALAGEAGIEAVLLTPVVSPGGLGCVASLLRGLEARGHHPTVAFNDWGVLDLLETAHPGLSRRAGRLLNRALRDPRLADPARPRPSAGGRGTRLRRLLSSHGVVGLETDPDLEGGYLGDGTDGLQRALHLPYSFATTGRNCLWKAGEAGDSGFTKALGQPCPAPCRNGCRPVHRQDTTVPLWRAGNTVFSEMPADIVARHLSRADRVVIHERPCP